ncbi:hypothetical protein GQ53DRAFT_753081 [Thozetella sp. PMI_491]|nr:hypothetical protein GQ53DRAFT_753081 [Thozetella sp. PMI_491]
MFLYGLYHFPKFWMPFAPQMPPWVGRWQWNAILVTSHIKVEIWSKIGTWFLGMQPTYPEYTPDRLKGVLDARPGEA